MTTTFITVAERDGGHLCAERDGPGGRILGEESAPAEPRGRFAMVLHWTSVFEAYLSQKMVSYIDHS